MTPGEIRGYARQAMKRKELSAEEKTAISMLLDGLDVMLAVAPIIAKANREIKNDRNNTSATSVTDTNGQAEPSTGRQGDDVLPGRKGSK